MGNSSSRDSRPRSSASPNAANSSSNSRNADLRVIPDVYTVRASAPASGSGGRVSRQEIPMFLSSRRGTGNGGSGSREDRERPRETKQEREARRAERERQARLKERETSMREEGVDGGYLVTLGVYTGPEDFGKSVVRQLQIERRLAPFWKGLNDHSEAWAEHQLVAAVRGLPIPAADEIPPEMARTGSQMSSSNVPQDPKGSIANVNTLTIPISSRSQSYESSQSANLSASHPAFSSSSGNNVSSTAQLLRGRAKTLASLATGSKSHSPDLTPQEIRLPHDPYVNGTALEAYLYKDASECPICFMYYPPYLNRTRCCDQPICSECFVQIKRPDPHLPEHEQPGQPRPPEEEANLLVSEVAACPFCVTPEFGVTYDPPPFRRGLAHAHQHNSSLRNPTSAMSSSTSLISAGAGSNFATAANITGRRRATSLSATSPQVITTDRVRPDWAKKLADARAHALRRSAAATALHNAAYVLGNVGGDGGSGGALRGTLPGFGRRRRTVFLDAPSGRGSASGSGTPMEGEADEEGVIVERRRGGGHRSRMEDIEEMMMMEAIRLSLAAEEERKRREEKEARKEAKKKDKEAKKEAKAAEKSARRNGPIASASNSATASGAMYQTGTNDSTSTWGSGTAMARSRSNLGVAGNSSSSQQLPGMIPEEAEASTSAGEGSGGKGKAPVVEQQEQPPPRQPDHDFAGFNPLTEPTSTLNTELSDQDNNSHPSFLPTDTLSKPSTPAPSFSQPTSAALDNPQKYLETSRANLQHSDPTTTTTPIPIPGTVSPQPLHSSTDTEAETRDAESLHSSAGASSFASASGNVSPAILGSASYGSVGGGGLAGDDGGAEPMVNFAELLKSNGGVGGIGGGESEGQAGGEKEGSRGEHLERVGAGADGGKEKEGQETTGGV